MRAILNKITVEVGENLRLIEVKRLEEDGGQVHAEAMFSAMTKAEEECAKRMFLRAGQQMEDY